MSGEGAEVIRQLAMVVQSLKHLQKDIGGLQEATAEDRQGYRSEVEALRGDLGVYLYEQAQHRADIVGLKKKLEIWPNRYKYWSPNSQNMKKDLMS